MNENLEDFTCSTVLRLLGNKYGLAVFTPHLSVSSGIFTKVAFIFMDDNSCAKCFGAQLILCVCIYLYIYISDVGVTPVIRT